MFREKNNTIKTSKGEVSREDVLFWTTHNNYYLSGEYSNLQEFSQILGVNLGLLKIILNELKLPKLPKDELRHRIKVNRENTLISKYGVSNVSSLSTFKDKISKSHKSRSTEQVIASNTLRTKTCKDKYNSEYFTQTQEYSAKYRETCQNKYGVEHHLKNYEVIAKRADTVLRKYGVVNVLNREDIKRKVKESKHINCLDFWESYLSECRYTLIDDYVGVHDSKINSFTEYRFRHETCGETFTGYFSNSQGKRMIRCKKCFPVKFGESEFNLLTYIEGLGFKVTAKNKDIIPPYEIDIMIPELNIGFEYNGTVWHSSKFGKPNNYHKNKTELALNNKVLLYHVWEHDDLNMIKSKISQILDKTKHRHYARKLSVREVVTKKQREFYNDNHLNGYCVSTFCLGLYSNDELISSMSFKLTNNSNIELVRFCSNMNTSVVGGFSRLLKHSIKHIKQNYVDVNKIVTFGYRDWCPDYKNSVYYKNGFSFIRYCNPSLKYYNDRDKVVYNRQKFMKYKLKDLFPETYSEDSTERDILEKNKIYSVYDSGTIRFEMDI